MVQKNNLNKPISQPKIFFSLTTTLALSFLFIVLFVDIDVNSIQVNAQESEEQKSIDLTAELVNNTYRWVDYNNNTNIINPILNISSEIETSITVRSLDDDTEEHELIIEGVNSNGDKEEIIASDEIEHGSFDTFKFDPDDLELSKYTTFAYYCEYHPDTMLGEIQITK